MKRRTRTLLVASVLGSILSVIAAPRVLPAYFKGETSLGYVADYKADLAEVWRGNKLSEDTWKKVQEQCTPDEARLEPLNGASEIYTHEVFCPTNADRARVVLSYIAAALLFPVLALLIGWILKGE